LCRDLGLKEPPSILSYAPSLGLAFTIVGMTVRIMGDTPEEAPPVPTRAHVTGRGRMTLEDPAPDLLDDEHVRRAYIGG
jgi:hypothetical protein